METEIKSGTSSDLHLRAIAIILKNVKIIRFKTNIVTKNNILKYINRKNYGVIVNNIS